MERRECACAFKLGGNGEILNSRNKGRVVKQMVVHRLGCTKLYNIRRRTDLGAEKQGIHICDSNLNLEIYVWRPQVFRCPVGKGSLMERRPRLGVKKCWRRALCGEFVYMLFSGKL